MKHHKFAASVPRKIYRSDEVGGHTNCPDCGSSLASEQHTYMVVTKRHGVQDFFMIGSNAGYFCIQCPIVVLDSRELEDLLLLVVKGTVFYVVLGIVDLDAVPEDKRDLPFDDETNPIPLVSFTNLDMKDSSDKQKGKHSGHGKSKKGKKGKKGR